MHRLAAIPGGWTPDAEGVIFVEQTPAPLVLISAADTDIQVMATACAQLPSDFPAVRMVNLLQLQQNLTIDTYAEQVLSQARGIVLRLLGGRGYWSYGLEVVRQLVEQTGATLFVLPGDERPDPDLISHSTVPLLAVDQMWRYFVEGGVENAVNALKFLANTSLATNYQPQLPFVIPRVGGYNWRSQDLSKQQDLSDQTLQPKAGILFYRAHYLAGNTAAIDALCASLAQRNLEPVPLFVSSLRDPDVQSEVLQQFQPKDAPPIQVLLNTTSFSLASLEAETPQVELWQQLDVPVLQVILSGGTAVDWQTQTRGLSPRDVAMNVALPEVDGRIISRAVSFKTVQTRHPSLETDVVVYQPQPDRINFVADLAANWVKLRQTPIHERRIALILANYPNRDGRLANGVGLDTPESCVAILKALQQAGYHITDLPQTGAELINRLTAARTNDPEAELRPCPQFLSVTAYQEYFSSLPSSVQQGITDRWGEPFPNQLPKSPTGELPEALPSQDPLPSLLHLSTPTPHTPHPTPPPIPIPGIQLGNLFLGIQPARGYDLDPSLSYHAPDLEPTHAYLAFYHWLRAQFGAQAIVHVGKHGNLEWLPGKAVALSADCYSEVALGAMPHLYPFIVNDPGEGAQAKRRSQAVILDHLTPPMTRAGLYGSLQQLENLVDEYYEALTLDPTRSRQIGDQILQLVTQEQLQQELGLATEENSADSSTPDALFNSLDRYLCELKEAQIRDGLHIFGQCPQGEQLRDLILSIARHPGRNRLGLTRAIAQDWQLDFDPLTADLGAAWSAPAALAPEIIAATQSCRTIGDVVELLETTAAAWIDEILLATASPAATIPDSVTLNASGSPPTPPFIALTGIPERGTSEPKTTPHSPPPTPHPPPPDLHWLTTHLLPALQQTDREITNLLNALNGGYVPSGASGAPTRGRSEVLPTGRNFYSVDIRAIPTENAWIVGRRAAETLIEQYAQEQGEFPRTLALSVWGTSTMRTGGDDIAEALALLGVQPVWDGSARRVIDFEILPLEALGRPRVDVTLRISGFFRDAFPNLIDLFQQAVEAVAALDEPADQNPLAVQAQQDLQTWQAAGLSDTEAAQQALYRVFGSKPGAYGAGLQGLIESQNWQSDRDLATAYLNWSGYAYRGSGEGTSAPIAFEQRLRQLQIVLQNQDNREHDLLDSDDYYQFQGGLAAAVRHLTGENPQLLFGDHSLPENPKVRTLQQEIARVYRSRVVNPKWIAGAMRHGYKGAFEMAATIDFLFAYDATARCVEDFMYQGVADAYLFDAAVQTFVQQVNPWAMRDMAERLLEANQRGLWQEVDQTTLEKLRDLVHQAEAVIEQI